MSRAERLLMWCLDMLTIVGAIAGFYLAWRAAGATYAMGSLATLAIACVLLPLSLSVIAHLAITRAHLPKR